MGWEASVVVEDFPLKEIFKILVLRPEVAGEGGSWKNAGERPLPAKGVACKALR